MIWAYYIELSRHMWADETAKKDYFYLPKGSVGDLYGYNEENQVDVETWDESSPIFQKRSSILRLLIWATRLRGNRTRKSARRARGQKSFSKLNLTKSVPWE